MPSIGDLAAKVTANSDQFSGGLDAAARDVDRFAARVNAAQSKGGGSGGVAGLAGGAGDLSALGEAAGPIGIALAAVAAGALATAAAADQMTHALVDLTRAGFEADLSLARMAQRLGDTTEGLSGLLVAGRLAGVSQEGMTAAVEHFERVLGQAASGSGEAAAALQALGLDAVKLADETPTQAFGEFLDALGRLPAGSARAAAAHQVLGRGARELGALIGTSRAQLDEFAASARKTGEVLSTVDASHVLGASRALEEARGVITGMGMQLAAHLAPAIEGAADKFVAWATSGKGAAAALTDGVDQIGTGIGYAVDAAGMFAAACQRDINDPVARAAATVADVWADMADAVASSPLMPVLDRVGQAFTFIGHMASTAAAVVQQMAADVLEALSRLSGPLRRLAGLGTGEAAGASGNGLHKMAEQLRSGADAIRKSADLALKGTDMMPQHFGDTAAWFNRLKAQGKGLPLPGAGQLGGGGQEALRKAVQQATDKLRDQVATLGLAGAALEVWKLRQQGATEVQLRGIVVLGQFQQALEQATSAPTGALTVYDDFATKLERLNALFSEGQRHTQTYASAYAKLADELQKAELAKGAELFQQTRAPLETFAAQLFQLNLLLQRGAINTEVFARSAFKDFEALAGVLGSVQEAKLPGVLAAGSKEALSFMHQFEASRDRETGQQRVERVLLAVKAVQEAQKTYQEQILDELRRRGVVREVRF